MLKNSSRQRPVSDVYYTNDQMNSVLRAAVVPALLVMAITISPAAFAGLIITPTFDSSITSNANSAAIEGMINQGIGTYEALFTDTVTVSILFRYSSTEPDGTSLSGGTLGLSNTTVYSVAFNTYKNALIADAKTTNDFTAVANLPSSPLSSKIDPSSAGGRAIGLNTPGALDSGGNVGTGGTFDGIVTLNSTQSFQFDRTGGIAPGNFDALRVTQHEIDEVLGLGSILPNTTDFTGNSAIRPQDLFRYSAPGTRSLTASSSAASYFSINGGVSNIVGFNQDSGGDFGDWLSPQCPASPALVQDAFSCPGQTADISATSPEGITLDVIGYDLNSVPEPDSVILVSCGVGLLAVIRRIAARRI